MMWIFCLLLANASAQTSGVLTLDQYLAQVKAQNPQARALLEAMQSAELRHDEPEQDVVTEFYATYREFDDHRQTLQPAVMGTDTKGDMFRLGLRKQTEFGLGANLYFNSQRANIAGISQSGPFAAFEPPAHYTQTAAVLELRQSLWRNAFGQTTRATIEAKRAGLNAEAMEARFNLKLLMLNAQNAYWTLVSSKEIVKLQQENVERAHKLRDHMNHGEKLRLFDDTDAMQSEAAFESRELELQTSLDQQAQATRAFNTLRGVTTDDLPPLDELPPKEFAVNDFNKSKMSREDYDLARARARYDAAMAKGAVAQIHPQLDLVGMMSTNGLGSTGQKADDLVMTDHYPSWYVGIEFSIPIDIQMLFDVKHGYYTKQRAADDNLRQADYNEERAWEDLVKQHHEALGRYQRAVNIEKIQTALVKRERQRLMNGRASTFEALNIEQNLALAQIQRVRSQLDFLQINNASKTFEAAK